MWHKIQFPLPGFILADPSAHVWKDGKLYIYGSLDENCNNYCSYRHHVMSTYDLKNWELYKNAFLSEGEGDGISYNDNLLFAPDAAFKRDTFYMYYCQPGNKIRRRSRNFIESNRTF